MADEVLNGLLDGAGVGDSELRDPREGEYEAVVDRVALTENGPNAKIRHALIVTYGDMIDANGRTFPVDDRINIPTSDADDTIKRMFLQSLHSLKLVPYSDKRPYFADSEEQRDVFLKAFQSLEGTRVPIRIVLDNEGWLRVRIRRR